MTMHARAHTPRFWSALLSLVFAASCVYPGAWAQTPPAQSVLPGTSSASAILNRDQASAILPAAVFFRGQSASIQGRNSAGIRHASGKLVLATLIDTSGYSSAIKQTYQAYLLTELPLSFGGKRLGPGAYGFGYLEDGHAVVMDLGGNELLRANLTRDSSLARPTPLQILPGPSGGEYRLYLGRSYVALTPSEK